MPISLSDLQPGIKVIVPCYSDQGSYVGFFLEEYERSSYDECEAEVVCVSRYTSGDGMGPPIRWVTLLVSEGRDGWIISPIIEANASSAYHGQRGYRVPINNIIAIAGTPRPKKKVKKHNPVSILCRGCGTKYPWIVGTSKRAYVCLSCRKECL